MTGDLKRQDPPFVAVIGGANVDICGASTSAIIAGDSNPGKVGISAGGVGRNIAENIARLGNDCFLFSAVGTDGFGDMICQSSEDAGVRIDRVLKIEQGRSSTYLSVLDEQGEMSVAINDMAAADHITCDYIAKHQSFLNDADIIVIEANIPTETLRYIAEHFCDHFIVADGVSISKVGKFADILGSINILKLNLAEARALSGVSSDDPKLMADYLHDRGGEHIYVTLGADGVYYSTGDDCGYKRAKNTGQTVLNVTGAGDAFVAGIVHGRLAGWDNEKILDCASIAAQITLEHDATISPELSREALMALME